MARQPGNLHRRPVEFRDAVTAAVAKLRSTGQMPDDRGFVDMLLEQALGVDPLFEEKREEAAMHARKLIADLSYPKLTAMKMEAGESLQNQTGRLVVVFDPSADPGALDARQAESLPANNGGINTDLEDLL